jgi:phosphatidylserine/phosphatidylglycerophosphate/cardiolipin synthase-like enzyme
MNAKSRSWLAVVGVTCAGVLLSSDQPSDPVGGRGPSGNPAPLDPGNFVHFEDLRIVDFKPGRRYLLSNTTARSRLQLINNTGVEAEISFQCDRPFVADVSEVKSGRKFREYAAKKKPMNRTAFRLKRDRAYAVLIERGTEECLLSYRDPKDPSRQGGAIIRNEVAAFPWLRSQIDHVESCSPESPPESLPVEKFFFRKSHPQLGCIHGNSVFEPLETPESGFLAKTEALLGYRLDPSFIENQNPDAELNFSRAPRLDAIFVATLVYRSDFYGTVLARMLKWHAERGTIVHLITTQYMMLEKDQRLLRSLAASHGNFRLQEFRYYDPDFFLGKPFRYIDTKYRDMHLKLFVTLSSTDPARNLVIVGGRNIHDGFLFRKMPDHSEYPGLVHFGVDEAFVHWADFEMKITSKSVAESVHAHLVKFWNRDSHTQEMTPFQMPGGGSASQDGSGAAAGAGGASLLRHFVSIPYEDNRALEKLFVELIDEARSTIKLSSPYLRPTPAILDALSRAVGRGVEVTVQTRISLKGDTAAWLYEEVNKESINRLLNRAKIYEWTGDSILHSKFILVDGVVGFIGSVNLSRRSFIQDTENGFLIRDREMMARMNTIFEGYLAQSRPITEKQKRKWFPSLVIRLLRDQF